MDSLLFHHLIYKFTAMTQNSIAYQNQPLATSPSLNEKQSPLNTRCYIETVVGLTLSVLLLFGFAGNSQENVMKVHRNKNTNTNTNGILTRQLNHFDARELGTYSIYSYSVILDVESFQSQKMKEAKKTYKPRKSINSSVNQTMYASDNEIYLHLTPSQMEYFSRAMVTALDNNTQLTCEYMPPVKSAAGMGSEITKFALADNLRFQ